MPSPEEEALRALLTLLQRMHGPAVVLRRVHIEYDAGRLHLGFDLAPADVLGQGSQPGPEEGPGRTETEQAILDVLAECERPLKGEAVARRGGRRFNAHFSRTIARMVETGEVLKVEGGYWLADRETPTEGEQ